MKSLFWMALAIAVIAVIVAALKAKKEPQSGDESPTAKTPLSENEKQFFKLIAVALPNSVVLAQVSFGALLNAKQFKVRNTFDRKIADFVLLDKELEVVACVELDDSSHRGREQDDAARDKMLTEAGYRVVRYAKRPTSEKLGIDFPNLR